MTLRSVLRCACAIMLLSVLGCGTEPDRATPTPTGLQPLNDTPQNTVLRLVAAYEQKKAAEYGALLTRDFTFEFSTASDPTLVQEYASGWFVPEETLAAIHLFGGGLNHEGQAVTRASRIDLTAVPAPPEDDAADGRDPLTHKVVLARVDGFIETDSTVSGGEIVHFLLENNFHRFFLVRGDAATGLGEGQPADSLHWYVWRWLDETTPVFGAPRAAPQPTRPASWGAVKALYL